MDLVSIILPVFNGEKYLSESIDSVIVQTYQNWELIIVDDCSSDNTPNIAKEYVKKDSRIKYYRNDVNLRLPRNLNKGFSLANGEYLTWTSDDNRYKPMAIEAMVNALEKNKSAQFVFASCHVINEMGQIIEYIMQSKDSRKKIVGLNPVGACFMYTRLVYEQVGEYDDNYALVEDFDYWQRICMKFSFIVLEDILYEYRWHDGALTSTMKKEQFYKTMEKMILKNIGGFGKLDLDNRYYYYRGLYDCRTNLKLQSNPYKFKYYLYNMIFFFRHRIPDKVKRMLQK